ncbi:MAG: hypothetical protein AAF804_07160 [Bacteroidota bacterium]
MNQITNLPKNLPRLLSQICLASFMLLASCQKETVCNNDCLWAQDGQCDDGEEGSVSSLCGAGTDCDDCGPRLVPK